MEYVLPLDLFSKPSEEEMHKRLDKFVRAVQTQFELMEQEIITLRQQVAKKQDA